MKNWILALCSFAFVLICWADSETSDLTLPIQLTTDPAIDAGPAWSPDGTQIAFDSDRSGNSDIWVLTIEPVAVELTTWGQLKTQY